MKSKVYISLYMLCLCMSTHLYTKSSREKIMDKVDPLIDHWRGYGEMSQLEANVIARNVMSFLRRLEQKDRDIVDVNMDRLRAALEQAYIGLNALEDRIHELEQQIGIHQGK